MTAVFITEERAEGSMVRGQAALALVGLILIALTTGLFGCGGGGATFPPDGGEPPVPPPVEGTARIEGVVVDSQNTATLIVGAQVVVRDSSTDKPAVVTDSAGRFLLEKLPAGGVTLLVTFPSTAAYQAMAVRVDTVAQNTTHVTIAALRSGATPPNSVTLTPANVEIDIGGEVQFDADVRAYGVPVNISPSFALVGDIGTLLPSGLFTATRVGTGKVTAFFPSASATATVEVTGPRPPQLGTLSVSPANLPADGGDVRIAISATDGDGIASVQAIISTLNQPPSTSWLTLESGSIRDGSWAGTFRAPANSNPIGPDGVQLEQRYSVRVRVVDRSGTAVMSRWLDFVVAGLEPPPSPP